MVALVSYVERYGMKWSWAISEVDTACGAEENH
jgi:hypothetical protein